MPLTESERDASGIVCKSRKKAKRTKKPNRGRSHLNASIKIKSKDLDEKKSQKRFNMLVKQGLNKFVKKPLKNSIGKSWIRKQRILKKQGK